MNIEHVGLLSWVYEVTSAQKHKDHAQDCETLITNEISVRRSCHGLYISDGVHPFGSTGILPRPAAGLLLDVFTHNRLRKSESGFRKIMRKTRARLRA